MISTDRQTTADTQSHKDPHHPATLHLHLYSIGPYTRYCRARRGDMELALMLALWTGQRQGDLY